MPYTLIIWLTSVGDRDAFVVLKKKKNFLFGITILRKQLISVTFYF